MNRAASRRGFLRGLTAFSAGAAAVAPAIVSATTPAADQELLSLGRTLSEAVAGLSRCEEAMAWAKEHFEGIRPSVPEELQLGQFYTRWVHTEWPPDALGRCNAKEAGHRTRIPCQYDIARVAKSVDGRTRHGKRVRRLKALSDTFHAEHEAAREASGMVQAACDLHRASRAVIDTGFAIMAIEATTVPGLAIKGRAGLAMHRAWQSDGFGMRQEPSYASLCANLAALDPTGASQCA